MSEEVTNDADLAEKNDAYPNDASPNTPNASEKGTKRVLVRAAKILIGLVVVLGLVWATKTALDQWQEHTNQLRAEIADFDERIASEPEPATRSELESKREALAASLPTFSNLNWFRVCMSMLLYTIGIFVPGFVLRAALRSLGERPSLRLAIAAQLLGHAGKYVPGKAMVILLRIGALSQENVNPVRSTVSVFMETLLMMAVGAAVACVVIVWLPVPVWMKWCAVTVAVLASLPTVPPVLKYVAARVSNNELEAINSNSERASSLSFFIQGWSWSLVSWMFIGASFTMLVSAIPSMTGSSTNPLVLAAVSTAAIALAVVVGFVSLLPGGAGIRELVLTTILATAIGAAHALLAALAARLMFIVVEGACAGGAWMWLRRNGQNIPVDE